MEVIVRLPTPLEPSMLNFMQAEFRLAVANPAAQLVGVVFRLFGTVRLGQAQISKLFIPPRVDHKQYIPNRQITY